MKTYQEMSKEELSSLKERLTAEYKEFQGKGLKLDMSRGKPSKAQLDLSMEMMDVLNSSSELVSEEGTDVRNYGILDGIKEARELLGAICEVPADNIIIDGKISLY